ncbi:MAG: hypothetical protein HY271_19390 [Deltaproteobacteria bacterium]|nr:hypothetical protein [Deltaproteobacteria bacterium]
MAPLQHGLRRRASVLLLASLLLVPVALSGHNHVRQSTHPCSICAVTHHAPAVSAPALPEFASHFTSLLSAPRLALAPSRTDQTPRAGRAPPAALHTVVA